MSSGKRNGPAGPGEAGRRPRACRLAAACRVRRGRGARKREAWRKGRKAGRGLARLRRSRVPLRLSVLLSSVHFSLPGLFVPRRLREARRGCARRVVGQGSVASGGGRRAFAADTDNSAQAPRLSGTDVEDTARPSGGVLRDRRLRPVLVAPVLLDHRFGRLFFRKRLAGDALDQVIDIVRTRRRRAAPHVVAVVDLAGNGEVRELPSDAQRLSGDPIVRAARRQRPFDCLSGSHPARTANRGNDRPHAEPARRD